MLKENKKTQKTQRIFAGAISFTIDDAYQQTEKTKKAIVNAIIVGAFFSLVQSMRIGVRCFMSLDKICTIGLINKSLLRVYQHRVKYPCAILFMHYATYILHNAIIYAIMQLQRNGFGESINIRRNDYVEE